MNLQNLVDYCELNDLPSPFAGASVPAPLDIDTALSAIMVRCGLLTPVYGDPDTFRNATAVWFERKQWTFEHLISVIQSEYSPIENVFEDRTERTTYNSHDTHTGGYKDTGSGKDTVKDSGTDTAKDSGKDTEALSGTDTEATSGTDTERLSGTDTEAHSGTDQRDIQNSGTDTTTNTISAFNTATYQPDNKTEFLNGKKVDDDLTHGESIGTTYGKTTGTTYGKSTGTTYGKKSDTTYGKQTDTTYGKQSDTTYGKSIERAYQDDKIAKGGYDELSMNRHGNIGVTSAQDLINQELELLRHFDIYGYIAECFEADNMIFVY